MLELDIIIDVTENTLTHCRFDQKD